EGDVVRAADLEKLEALGLATPAVEWPDIASSFLLVVVVVVLVAGYIWGFEPWLLSRERMLLLIALVMLATVVSAKILLPGRPYWQYIFPISGVAMLLATLVDAQLAILVTSLLGILVGSVAGDSLELTTICIVGTVIGAIGIRRSEKLYTYFIAGAMVALGTYAVILVYRLSAKDLDLVELATRAGLAGINGLLASTLTVGTFSLLGRLFGITTSMQLLELSDPTQPLLRRLLNEAPGTYHHSIMVGNLAERAAERVGADPLLVRVGAYYHDIGKLARPYFFIENQFDGHNAHDALDPQTSARIVAAHVKDGLDLAARYRLPPRVKEFITEHHGTRLVSFFYQRATQESGGDVDVSRYRYPGPTPRSKEAGIVMLADSVEAVVRSAKDHSPDNIAAVVGRVVGERVAEGQLDDCDLTMRDLETIKQSFTEILTGMYHPRIEYPSTAEPEPLRAGQQAEPRAGGEAGNAQQESA
ncbi:MAG TPA: HDIG domain-containing protein, partial [Chloroflexota bacterium]